MNEMNFDWDDLRLFLAVARHGGLAPAAEVTGKSPPTLGRRMLALEKATGTELFHRLPRGYELTAQGRAFLDKVTALEAQIAPLSGAGRLRKPLVKISAGTWMTQILCKHVAQIIGADNQASLRFISADHTLDIARREAVIGIRNQRPEQIGLACRRVGTVQFAGYALRQDIEPWALVLGKTPSARWLADVTDSANRIEVTNPRNALDLAQAGAARVLLPTIIGDATGPLIRVTPPIDALAHDQWLVTHHEERFVPDVRKIIDRVHQVLGTLHSRSG